MLTASGYKLCWLLMMSCKCPRVELALASGGIHTALSMTTLSYRRLCAEHNAAVFTIRQLQFIHLVGAGDCVAQENASNCWFVWSLPCLPRHPAPPLMGGNQGRDRASGDVQSHVVSVKKLPAHWMIPFLGNRVGSRLCLSQYYQVE